MPAAPPLVELDDVHKQYARGRQPVVALRGVSLAVGRASFVVVEGPSGSGKSTLLNILGCLDRPSRGTVRVGGADTGRLGDAELARLRARTLGFVFQEFNLIPVLTAAENVACPLEMLGMPRAEVAARTRDMLGAVGLGAEADRRPAELSGGQCQRVAIGRALVARPQLVLADEPTANLDSATGRTIIGLMHEMQQRFGTTFIIATHDPALAGRADRRLHMLDGRLGRA
jgi:putative ABC transport system ATP-binding protein